MTLSTITTATISGENALTTTGTIAVLPPALLWAASLVASSDSHKGVLCSIDIRRMNGEIAICSTDGHRVFRVMIPETEMFYITKEQTEPFRLNPKAFSKAGNKKMETCRIDSNGTAQFNNALGQPVDACAWQAETWANAIGQVFPKYMQIWPEDSALVCAPGKAIAFNARYIGDFCKVVEKLTENNVLKFYTTKSAIQPCIIKANFKLGSELITLDYLIMPVQIRD